MATLESLRGGAPLAYVNDPVAVATSLSSAGGAESLVTDGAGPTLSVKGLTAGSDISLTPSGTDLTIAYTGAAPTAGPRGVYASSGNFVTTAAGTDDMPHAPGALTAASLMALDAPGEHFTFSHTGTATIRVAVMIRYTYSVLGSAATVSVQFRKNGVAEGTGFNGFLPAATTPTTTELHFEMLMDVVNTDIVDCQFTNNGDQNSSVSQHVITISTVA